MIDGDCWQTAMNERSYDIFEAQLSEAVKRYPKLGIEQGEAGCFLRGMFDVIDDEGQLWESFEIEVRHAHGFPMRFPKLYEVGGKIPRIDAWHVNPGDGSLCITVPAEERLACLEVGGLTVIDFIERYARPHLANQAFRKRKGCYVNGEYSHGDKGILEYYQHQLGVKEPKAVASLLRQIAAGKKPDRRSKCFCGSGKKFRHCHRAIWERFEALGKEILDREAMQIYLGTLGLEYKNVDTQL